MAITYATPAFNFVDSQFGTAATSTGIKVNVPVIVEKRYHRKVQAKNIFKKNGWIGDDTFGEGDNEQTVAGYPVIRKTNFSSGRGDTTVMAQRTNLAATGNVGKVMGAQLVDAELGWDVNYKKVKIEQWRQGVLTASGMTEQRNPFDESLQETEEKLLSEWTANVQDNGIIYAAHYGHCPHLLRAYGTTNCPVAASSNYLCGNDTTLDTSRTVANLNGDGSDNLKGITFELADVYMRQNYFDPVKIDGSEYWLALISPMAALKLLRDSDFRNALQYARERGVDNPLFQHAKFVYGNCLIFESDKIRSLLGGYNPAGLTVSSAGTSGTITEAVYTGVGGGITASSTTIHQTLFFGANAVALAEGRMRMADRIENDYGQLIGRDADNIWGAQRMDWYDQTATLNNNQSLLQVVNTLTS